MPGFFQRISLRNKLLGLSLLSWLGITLMGLIGVFITNAIHTGLLRAELGTQAVRNQMQADMMHDALRADVLTALYYAGQPTGAESLNETKKEVAEHAASLRKAFSENQALPLPAHLQDAFQKIQPALDHYAQQAEHLVGLSGTNVEQARQQLAAFMQEFAALETSMEETGDAIEKTVSDYQLAGQALFQRSLWVIAGAALLCALLFALVVFWIARSLLRQIGGEPDYALQIIEKLTAGDLSVSIQLRNPTDVSLLGGIKNMAERMTTVVRGIDETNRGIGQSIFQVSTISKEISDINAAQQQESSSVNKATDALKEILTSLQQLAGSAQAKTEAVENLAQTGMQSVQKIIAETEQAVQQVGSTEQSVRELAAASNEINAILASIKEIAGQTNLLALNAAIEAARAGEQGRGFAVVADEVRTLAIRTGEATQRIEQIVSGFNNKVSETLNTMTAMSGLVMHVKDQALGNGDSIQLMASQAKESSEFNQRIASQSLDQLAQLEELRQRLERLFKTMRDNESTLDVTHTISDALHETVNILQQRIEYFQYADTQSPTRSIEQGKRKHQRTQNSLFVTVQGMGKKWTGISKDFSAGGMLLVLGADAPFRPNEILELILKPPAENVNQYLGSATIQVKGRVVRIDKSTAKEKRFGIQFVDVDRNTQEQLQAAFDFFTRAGQAA